MAKCRTFTAEFKTRVVLEIISGVKSSAEICRDHNLKPQIAYLLFLAALIWSVHRRNWIAIGGFAITLIGATAISTVFNQQIIIQYLYAVRHYPPSDWVTPTIGGILRLLLGSDKFWLQFFAPLLGVFWLIVYWLRNRTTWDWLAQAPLIILMSLLTSAYGWSFDQPSSLVAIIQIFVLISYFTWQRYSTFILLSYVIINALIIFSPGNEFFFGWRPHYYFGIWHQDG